MKQSEPKSPGKLNNSIVFKTFSIILQFLTYVIGGGASTIIDIVIVAGLICIQITDLTAVTAGFLCGLIINYAYHARITFRSKISMPTIVKYLVVVIINYCLTLFIVFYARDTYSYNVIIGKIISTPFIAINGYILAKFWIFNKEDTL